MLSVLFVFIDDSRPRRNVIIMLMQFYVHCAAPGSAAMCPYARSCRLHGRPCYKP